MSIREEKSLPSIAESERWFARARGLSPCFTQTLAKGPTQYVRGVAPKYLVRGRGAHVWDADGNEFIDLTMGVGPLSLGYCYPAVDDAIRAQLERGITFSLMHPLEIVVAEAVRELVPGTECVRFSKTGADVASAAVRLARAHTGRDRVVCVGYHGWHDWYAGLLPRKGGVPADVRKLATSLPYGDLGAAREVVDDSVACVILEPVLFQDPGEDFLPGLRALCDKTGALLVFDEMWTGFRLAFGGAQAHFGIRADLACFSKAIANGMPLSVLTGRREVMRHLEEDVFFFTTFGGEALSLAAAKATIEELVREDVPSHIARQGRRLRTFYDELARDLGLSFTKTAGLDCRVMIEFTGESPDPLLAKSLVQQELIRHGVLWSGFHNLSYSHGDSEIQHVMEAYFAALHVLHDAVRTGDIASRLRGEPIQPTFRPTR